MLRILATPLPLAIADRNRMIDQVAELQCESMNHCLLAESGHSSSKMSLYIVDVFCGKKTPFTSESLILKTTSVRTSFGLLDSGQSCVDSCAVFRYSSEELHHDTR